MFSIFKNIEVGSFKTVRWGWCIKWGVIGAIVVTVAFALITDPMFVLDKIKNLR